MQSASDFEMQTDKLKVPDDWPKWKWQILMLLHAHCSEGITDGSWKCPVLPADAQPQQTEELAKWQQDDIKAASIIASALNKSVSELVLTCTNAKDIWDKLCAWFECSSMQWLNMLIESFFQAQHDKKSNSMTVNPSKSMKRRADHAKQKFSCNKCKQLGHWTCRVSSKAAACKEQRW